MPLYSYVALNEKGRKMRGKVTAVNDVDLEARLKSIGLDLLSCRETQEARGALFGKITLQDLVIICVHMEQLEKAGVPILDAIADLRDSADSALLKIVMAEIHESIKNGSMLSSALAEHPKIFNKVFTSLIAVGEKTGNLGEVFYHLAHHLKWVGSIQKKIRKAIYYPIFLLILMMGIMALMMLFVIPKLSAFLLAQNFELPPYTVALIATSHFFSEYWYAIFLTPIVILIMLKILIKVSDDFAYNVDLFKLYLPYLGATIRKLELARFCHFFGITFKSGLGILECLDIAYNVVQNRVIKENIATIKRSVTEGSSLTAALRVSNQFPNLVIRMFKIGEESGNLEGTLENINFFYDREVDDSVSAMVGIIQPALTIVMGGLMMWISLSIFGPLYNSFSKMNF